MEQLILHNLNKNITLGNVLKEHGVKFIDFEKYWVISHSETIGVGVNGKVLDIGNGKVLKISKDFNEYNAILLLMEELKNDSEAWWKHIVSLPLVVCPVNEDFYEHLDDDSYNDDKKYVRYYFIHKKLYNLSDIENECFFKIMNYFDVSNIDEIIVDYGEEMSEYFDNIYKEVKEYEDKINVSVFLLFIFNAYELSKEFGLFDMHVDNIMKDENGNYKLIDIRL